MQELHHNTISFDLVRQKVSNTFGYVLQHHKVDEIVKDGVKEWEIRRKSSFTPWMAHKNFGNIGVFLHIYF